MWDKYVLDLEKFFFTFWDRHIFQYEKKYISQFETNTFNNSEKYISQGEQKWPQGNSRTWNISATDEQKRNPIFASKVFLELKGMWWKKTIIRHVFPSIIVSTNRNWVYILETKNETFDTPLIVDILYFEQTTKNEIKWNMSLTNQDLPLIPWDTCGASSDSISLLFSWGLFFPFKRNTFHKGKRNLSAMWGKMEYLSNRWTKMESDFCVRSVFGIKGHVKKENRITSCFSLNLSFDQ